MDLRYKILLFIILLLTLLTQIKYVYAANSIVIENAPNQLVINEEGIIRFSATLLANTDYYVKVRSSTEDNNTSYIETNNPDTGAWLSDTQDWELMPKLTTISDGSVKAPLSFRFKINTKPGINKVTVRFVKIDDKKNPLDSNSIEISLKEIEQTPTPLPTTTPTFTNTPKPSNSPTPISTPDTHDYNNIKLSEIYASPESGENEWVELYNDNDHSVDLNGWYIQDNAGTYKEIKDFSIGNKTYAYFAFGSGYLNNIGDTVTLLNSNKQIKDSLPAAYPNLNKDQSWARVGSDWCITSPSKGEVNNNCSNETTASTTPKPSIKSSATPKASQEPTEKNSSVDLDSNSRNLPVLGTADTANSKGNSTASSSGKIKNTNSKILLPLGIAGSGLVLLGGSLTALTKPEIFANIIKIIVNR